VGALCGALWGALCGALWGALCGALSGLLSPSACGLASGGSLALICVVRLAALDAGVSDLVDATTARALPSVCPGAIALTTAATAAVRAPAPTTLAPRTRATRAKAASRLCWAAIWSARGRE
jgi:hypothetical protein